MPGFLLAAISVVALTHAFAQDSDSAKRGRKYKAPPPTSHVVVTVVRATNGKPIEDAAVIFHPLMDGHDNGNMELKTNEDGKTTIDLLVTGSSVRVQIIADGFQTYGNDYKIDKDNMAIDVKLKRPVAQYSIYKKSEGAAASTDKPADAPKDTAPDASKDPKNGDAKDGAAKDATPDAPKNDSSPQDSAATPK
ncbi:carboxypeptidase-like regulatory domain-containing protein [Acidicapsa acidisoli]|uniref:carboxypeptidase-like regulatory domain-containing protein n=1 Tax=Acidicapsa acidisoli TaxID=1615681 RepID=UPI0021E0E9BA|nr:carboxypeptidase-like regulatory domain-containing protein [Acidicapsa acidisoli]